MYICEECKNTFNEPKKECAESYYGVYSDFGYSCGTMISMCPYCGGNYKEYKEEEYDEEESEDSEESE